MVQYANMFSFGRNHWVNCSVPTSKCPRGKIYKVRKYWPNLPPQSDRTNPDRVRFKVSRDATNSLPETRNTRICTNDNVGEYQNLINAMNTTPWNMARVSNTSLFFSSLNWSKSPSLSAKSRRTLHLTIREEREREETGSLAHRRNIAAYLVNSNMGLAFYTSD